MKDENALHNANHPARCYYCGGWFSKHVDGCSYDDPFPIRPDLKKPEPPTLTPAEKTILCKLGLLWNDFLALPDRPEADTNDFYQAIHTLQRIIGTRVARRVDPEVWK